MWWKFMPVLLAIVLCENQTNLTSTKSTTVEIKTTTPLPVKITSISPNTTTASPVINQTTPKPSTTSKISKILKGLKRSSTATCTCNLKLNICDINCCCDPDCNFQRKEVFNFCSDQEHLHRDSKFCKYLDYIYLNNSRFEWEVQQNSLFCIEKTNLPSQYTVQKKQKITSLAEADIAKLNKNTWNDIKNVGDKKLSSKFVHGSNLWIVRNNTLEFFELPTAFITNSCLKSSKIQYLEEFNSKCTQTEFESNPVLSPEYFQNVSFIKQITESKLKLINSNITYLSKEMYLPVETQICTEDFRNCKNSSLISKTGCQFNPLHNMQTCLNLVERVKYNIYHNGTEGVKKVDLLLILKNISVFTGDEFTQSFKVCYFWFNSTYDYGAVRSGNPGYLIGKPILICSRIFINQSDNNTTSKMVEKLLRSSKEVADYFLVLPENRNGYCILNNQYNKKIEFGYNSITKCRIRRLIYFANNATRTCQEIQKLIFNYWSLRGTNQTSFNKLFGTFGNANISNSHDWSSILFDKSPGEILNATSGNLTVLNTTIICYNLTTRLNINLFNSKMKYEQSKDQEKIVGITVEFTGEQNFEFEITKKKEIIVEVELRAQVWFFDVTTEKIVKFVEPPGFHIRLPYDFFYPFIRVENDSVVFKPKFVLILVSLMMSICY